MSGNRLLLTALALFLVTFSLRAAVPPAAHPASEAAPPPASSGTDYLGSQACARCHEEDYAQWKRSLHVRMTKPIEEADVLGDFSGVRLSAHGRQFEFGRANGRPFIRVTFGAGKPTTFSVDYMLGFKRFQGYLSKLADGRIYVLPAFWQVDAQRWIDWKEITPVPDGAHDFRQLWNINCFNCHATNLSQGFNAETARYDTTWTEMGVGCEACHGPGRRHVELIETALKDPSLKPGGTLEVYSSPNGFPRQSFDTCAYCHGNKQNIFVGFKAGDRYEDYALPFLISAPIPESDQQGEFWPDGRPNRFNRPQALMMSGCFKAGEVACTSCHVAHGSPYPFSLRVDITRRREGDTLCTQCHAPATLAPKAGEGVAAAADALRALERHTFHRADSEGSRCISCHMSDVNWRLLIRRRDHTFQAPVPEITAQFGAPNACTTCHDDRTPEWAAGWMDKWWANGERRSAALAVADTMYRAGAGDPSTIPALTRLAIDRTQSVIVRASAVQFIERFALGAGATPDGQSQTSFVGPGPGPAAQPRPPSRGPIALTHNQINALIGAAADPEPIIRAHAVNALLATGARDRIVTPITARLVDPVRVVRARAAEALLVLGITDLPGPAGEALARAQDDFAQALADFPDDAANHAELGWLEAERDRYAEATRALDTAIRLDPAAARPWVVKGVIAARQQRFADAVTLWRKAKALDPRYPNLDQMIAEAEKRKAAGIR